MNELLDLIFEYRFGIFGGILVASFGAHLVWRNNRKSRYAIACGKFRADVLSSLIGLYPSPTSWPVEKISIINELKKRLPMLQAAVAEFRPQVPFWERWLFDIAWRRYLNGERWAYGTRQDYWQYVPHTGDGISNGKRYSHDNRLTYQSDFKRNVDRLLSYAKET